MTKQETLPKGLQNLTSSRHLVIYYFKGAQWLSGRVVDWRQRDRVFKPHRRHCVVVLEQDTFILA